MQRYRKVFGGEIGMDHDKECKCIDCEALRFINNSIKNSLSKVSIVLKSLAKKMIDSEVENINNDNLSIATKDLLSSIEIYKVFYMAKLLAGELKGDEK